MQELDQVPALHGIGILSTDVQQLQLSFPVQSKVRFFRSDKPRLPGSQ
jgi:hypothetical protein